MAEHEMLFDYKLINMTIFGVFLKEIVFIRSYLVHV